MCWEWGPGLRRCSNALMGIFFFYCFSYVFSVCEVCLHQVVGSLICHGNLSKIISKIAQKYLKCKINLANSIGRHIYGMSLKAPYRQGREGCISCVSPHKQLSVELNAVMIYVFDTLLVHLKSWWLSGGKLITSWSGSLKKAEGSDHAYEFYSHKFFIKLPYNYFLSKC